MAVRLRVLAVVLLLLATSTGAFGRGRPWPEPIGQLDRDQVVAQYLQGRALDPFEGIWISDTNDYEVAIIRNKEGSYQTGEYQGYDYVGVVISSTREGWKRGQMKCVLRRTANALIAPGIWFMANRSTNGTTFVVTDSTTIKYTTQLPWGETREDTLLRVYPRRFPCPAAHPAGRSSVPAVSSPLAS
jgi:hypothetical protein